MKFGHGLYPSCAFTASACAGNFAARGIRFLFFGALAALLAIVNMTAPTWAGLPPAAKSSISVAISPSGASFGGVAVGTSKSQTFRITNNASVRVSFNPFTVSGTGFRLANVPSDLTLGPHTYITLSVVFAPRSPSEYSASIHLVFGGVVLASIPLSGTGTPGKTAAVVPAVLPSVGITVVPSSANFGKVPVGTSNSQTIKITNLGSARVTFPAVTVSGSGFAVANVPSSLTLASGTSITFNAVFAPRSASPYSASIPLTVGGKTVASIALSGTGVSSNVSLSVNTSSLSFGNVNVGGKTSSPVTVTNKGNSNATIASVTVKGVGFTASGITNNTVLTPGQSATLNVSFSPAATGATSGTISIASNAPSSPTISLAGTGVQSTASSVSLRWQAVSNILGYFVYRATASGGPFTKVSPSVISSLQYVDSMVTPGHTYYYVVTAVDSGYVESSYSNQAEASVPVAH